MDEEQIELEKKFSLQINSREYDKFYDDLEHEIMIKVDLQKLWHERSVIKRLQSSETSIVNEKIQDELEELIFGKAYEFLVFDKKIKVLVSLGLYRSESKAKSRVKLTKSLRGYQVAIRVQAEATPSASESEQAEIKGFTIFSTIEIFTEQLGRSRRKPFRFTTNGLAKIEVFDNVGVEETEKEMVLILMLDLDGLYNKVCNDYAGIINQGKDW